MVDLKTARKWVEWFLETRGTGHFTVGALFYGAVAVLGQWVFSPLSQPTLIAIGVGGVGVSMGVHKLVSSLAE
jgi:membrane associated rhomboid family serine protease